MKKLNRAKTSRKQASEAREREFWHAHDVTPFFDFSPKKRLQIEFDPSVTKPVKSISLRLPREMLNALRLLATKRDVPYQSLIKMFLADRIRQESTGR